MEMANAGEAGLAGPCHEDGMEAPAADMETAADHVNITIDADNTQFVFFLFGRTYV